MTKFRIKTENPVEIDIYRYRNVLYVYYFNIQLFFFIRTLKNHLISQAQISATAKIRVYNMGFSQIMISTIFHKRFRAKHYNNIILL